MTHITDQALRILETPKGAHPGCTWVASDEEWRTAALRALDGDTDDLEYFLDQEAAELWLMPEWQQDAWFKTRASESTVPPMGRAA